LADQRGAFHLAAAIRRRFSGDADRNLSLAEQRIDLTAVRRMAVHDLLALEGVFLLHAVAAGVVEISVPAPDHAVAEDNDARPLAGVTVQEANVNRVQPVFHFVPCRRDTGVATAPL